MRDLIESNKSILSKDNQERELLKEIQGLDLQLTLQSAPKLYNFSEILARSSTNSSHQMLTSSQDIRASTVYTDPPIV